MINDHTDAAYNTLAHEYEMGADSPEDRKFYAWCDRAKHGLCRLGITNDVQGLDGNEETDGFSLDFASDAFDAGATPEDYIRAVIMKRHALGIYSDAATAEETADDAMLFVTDVEAWAKKIEAKR